MWQLFQIKIPKYPTHVENLHVKKQAAAASEDSGPIMPEIDVVSL